MEIVVVIGGRIKYLQQEALPSTFIWPYCEIGDEKDLCLKIVNKSKLLQQSLLWIQKIATGNDLRLINKYSDCTSDIIFVLNGLRRKKRWLPNKNHLLVRYVNKFSILSHLFEKLLWKIALNSM